MKKTGAGRNADDAARVRRHARPAGVPARRRALLGVAVVVGLVAGAGSAWATSADPRVSGLFGGETTPATAASESPGDVVSDEAAPEADAKKSSSLEDPDPVAAPSEVAVPVEPVPEVVALPPGLTAADVASGLLSADVPEVAGGTFVVVPGSDPGPGTGTVRTVRVEVEAGLAVDGALFAATVMATLNDARGWGGDGSTSFARTDGEAELRVLLASPKTVDALCAPLRTRGEVSCGRAGHAALNLRRWVEATPEYAADKVLYRQYLVNHEVGHLLGHQHESCGGAGQIAPVMQQQSYQVAPCLPNAWPFP